MYQLLCDSSIPSRIVRMKTENVEMLLASTAPSLMKLR